MFRTTTEGILKRGQIVYGDGHYAIDADRLQDLREITGSDGIACFSLPFFTRVAQIGRDERYPLCSRLLQRANEEH